MTWLEEFKTKHDKDFINFQIEFARDFVGCKTYILEWFRFAIDLELKRRYKEHKIRENNNE